MMHYATMAIPADPRAKRAISRWDELRGDRSQHEQLWTDIARLIQPQRGGFGTDTPHSRSIDKPLSSAAIQAADNFSAGLYGTLTNPANKWFSFQTNDTDLNTWHPAKAWLDHVTERVARSFGPSVSPFYSAATQFFSDLCAFGNAIQYDEVRQTDRKIMDLTLSLSECCIAVDGYGMVCEAVRKFWLTASQALSMFPAESLPKRVVECAEKGDMVKHPFYHHIFKNAEWRPFYKLGPKGKQWLSLYVCEVDATLVRINGYHEMPIFAARWKVDTGQTYGLGPGFVALPSARTLNRMDDAVIRAAQKAADPTLLAPDRSDFPLEGRIRPGEVVYGSVDGQGRALIRPLDMTGNIGLTLQDRQHQIELVRDAFHYTLLQLAGRTGMTATEVMAITEERQRLWAPHQGRVQEEFLARKMERRFNILWRMGQIDPPPEGMEGAELTVTYESAAAAAQKSVEGNATLRFLQDLTPLMQIDPRAAERLDTDGLVETLADARGVPARVLRSREVADDLARQRQEQQQAMQAMAAMQAGAGALKDAAGAEAALQQAAQAGAGA